MDGIFDRIKRIKRIVGKQRQAYPNPFNLINPVKVPSAVRSWL
jgi:hypothetical protein